MVKDISKNAMVREIKGYIDASAQGLRKEIKGVKEELRLEIKEVREGLQSETEEVKRHTGVLVEGLRSEVKLVFEQHGTVIRKLEDHDLRFDRIDLELKGMKIALFDNSHRLNDHEGRIRKLEMRN